MAAIRSVRFSEFPAVKLHSAADVKPDKTNKFVVQFPRIYDDALFGPYDVYTAASIGDVEIVEAQLQSGFDPNRLNSSKWSALMYASYLGHDNICNILIKHGASVNLTNGKGQTALMLASCCGNVAVVKQLISKGAHIDRQDELGDTALGYATACSQSTVVEILLEAGADPNMPNNAGMTPTLTACSIAHEITLITLLKNDGDARIKNKKGEDGEILAFDNPKAIAIIKDPPMNKGASKRKGSEIKLLSDLLQQLNLEKYIPIFEAENIDLKLFLQLTDTEIAEMGVKAFGPRKKMLNVIDRYRKDGTILTNIDPEIKHEMIEERVRNKVKSRSEQVTNELMECQQNLAECKQELHKAHKIIHEQQNVIKAISETGKISRELAYAMLEEIKHNSDYARFEKGVSSLIKNIDNMAMKVLELSQL